MTARKSLLPALAEASPLPGIGRTQSQPISIPTPSHIHPALPSPSPRTLIDRGSLRKPREARDRLGSTPVGSPLEAKKLPLSAHKRLLSSNFIDWPDESTADADSDSLSAHPIHEITRGMRDAATLTDPLLPDAREAGADALFILHRSTSVDGAVPAHGSQNGDSAADTGPDAAVFPSSVRSPALSRQRSCSDPSLQFSSGDHPVLRDLGALAQRGPEVSTRDLDAKSEPREGEFAQHPIDYLTPATRRALNSPLPSPGGPAPRSQQQSVAVPTPFASVIPAPHGFVPSSPPSTPPRTLHTPEERTPYRPSARRSSQTSPLLSPSHMQNVPQLQPVAEGKAALRDLTPLHYEILQFVELHSPSAQHNEQRQALIQDLASIIFDLWDDVEIHLIGSSATGLALIDSDVDLVVRRPGKPMDQQHLFQLASALEPLVQHLEDLQVISTAAVPLVKYRDHISGLFVDITFNVSSGLLSTVQTLKYVDDFPSFKPLVMLLKLFLQRRGLNSLFTGGLPSFALSLLVVSTLQQFHPNNDLGFLLLAFLDMFSGNSFDYEHLGISVRERGGFFPKSTRGWNYPGRPHLLALENPVDEQQDLGFKVFGINAVKAAFAQALEQLRRSVPLAQVIMGEHGEQILNHFHDPAHLALVPVKEISPHAIVSPPALAPAVVVDTSAVSRSHMPLPSPPALAPTVPAPLASAAAPVAPQTTTSTTPTPAPIAPTAAPAAPRALQPQPMQRQQSWSTIAAAPSAPSALQPMTTNHSVATHAHNPHNPGPKKGGGHGKRGRKQRGRGRGRPQTSKA